MSGTCGTRCGMQNAGRQRLCTSPSGGVDIKERLGWIGSILWHTRHRRRGCKM